MNTLNPCAAGHTYENRQQWCVHCEVRRLQNELHDVEVNTDPAGEVRRCRLAEDENAMLRAKVSELINELRNERDRDKKHLNCRNAEQQLLRQLEVAEGRL